MRPATLSNKYTKLPRPPTVRIYCQTNNALSITTQNGTVVLASTESNNYYESQQVPNNTISCSDTEIGVGLTVNPDRRLCRQLGVFVAGSNWWSVAGRVEVVTKRNVGSSWVPLIVFTSRVINVWF